MMEQRWRNRIICGDALSVLKKMPDNVIQCCVTSPPYWGLREYGNGSEGIGLEPTFDEYVERIVAVFREVRRVLRDDGVMFLNMGDSYATQPAGNKIPSGFQQKSGSCVDGSQAQYQSTHKPVFSVKYKDLIGQPWRVAFALRAGFSTCDRCGLELRTDLWPIRTGHLVCWDCRGDSKIIRTELGWYLRSDIIWHKPNPMPESVRDRPTKSHEYVFLMTKKSRYYYNADAIREPNTPAGLKRFSGSPVKLGGLKNSEREDRPFSGVMMSEAVGRNKRTVWTIPTAPFPEAHFATFPPKLVEPCVMAGTPPKCCGVCAAPWEAVVERSTDVFNDKEAQQQQRCAGVISGGTAKVTLGVTKHVKRELTGYRPTCDHDDDGSGRSIVLDPFMGAGTVGLVAKKNLQDFVGIELNPEYCQMARRRIDVKVVNGADL